MGIFVIFIIYIHLTVTFKTEYRFGDINCGRYFCIDTFVAVKVTVCVRNSLSRFCLAVGSFIRLFYDDRLGIE